MIGGSKGGVGRSLVAMAAIDHLQSKRENTLLVESDTSNPDVSKAYREDVPNDQVNLDEADGCVSL